MSDAKNMDVDAAAGQKPVAALNQRFDFASYAETRRFLDQLADLSKREDYYPNINFGKTYANISIDGEGQAVLRERNSNFISDMHALAATPINA
jgi:Pterin 4 alpha carbinolamine dehydratase.